MRKISQSCDKRSTLTQKLGEIAKQIEDEEGRQHIRARKEYTVAVAGV